MNYLEVITATVIGTLLIIFIVVAWLSGALKDAYEDGISEMKENWPIFLLLATFGVVIPTILALVASIE